MQKHKRITLLVVFIGFTLLCKAQKTDTILHFGNLIVRTFNTDGVLHGPYKVYNEAEDLIEKGNYKNGKREGKWYFYSYPVCHACEERDKKEVERFWLMATIKYKNDVRHGECWFQLGEQSWPEDFKAAHDVCFGYYKNGKPVETWYLHNVFDESVYGRRIAELKFENGEKKGPVKIDQALSLQGIVLPYETFLDSVSARLVAADKSYAEGNYSSGEKTGTWKYYTSGGKFYKEEAFSKGKGKVKKEVAVTNIAINDLSLKKIKYMDVSGDSSLLLLSTSDWHGNAKYWMFRTHDGTMVRKGEIAMNSIGSIGFLNGLNDMLCLYDYQDGLSYQFDLNQNKIVSKEKGNCEKFYDLFYTLKSDLKYYGLKSLDELKISKPNWYEFEKIHHYNDYLAILLKTDSADSNSAATIDLASGTVQFTATENTKSFQAMVDNDIKRKYDTQEGAVIKKDIDDYSVSDFSFNGAYFKSEKSGRKIYNQQDLINDVEKYLDTWSFFIPGKSEKKHFNFAYENKVSYIDEREDFGHIYFWNGNLSNKHERTVRLNISQNNKYIFYTPDMYYCGSSNLDNMIYFEQNLKLYPFEQFDLKYNRPDIILQRLGYSDSLTVASYHKAYLKRLKKMNFTEDMLKEDFHLPEIKIENLEKFPSLTDTSAVELNLEVRDSVYNLDRINVYINNVPVYGSNGINLRDVSSKKINKTIMLELAEGANKIQVSVLNQAGAESYKETLEIIYKRKDAGKPDLYLVSIGDSKYKDTRYNLTYASKDAEDIKSGFVANGLYNKVNAFVYTDEKVTKENILALKKELQKAKRNDVVIITVAGHGVLDKNFDYYLATYDMDFDNPAEKGIPYEQLENLVDGISALKKVIFIDACHSGEIDKEEVEQLAVANTSNTNVKFRAAGAGIQKKQLGVKSTGELMSEIFSDLRKGTGATVVSSAGGAEYAMESAEWKNGLFTYCLMHGLKDNAADANKDGKIMLSELQHYLRNEVSRLSNGAQQPTSRIENLSMDFRIW